MRRVYYIDWLRVFAVLLLVPFHTAMIFVFWDFHLKNPERSAILTDFNSFLHMWQMSLLFVLELLEWGCRSLCRIFVFLWPVSHILGIA